MISSPKGKIFILSGPSGSGKTTLYKKLLSENKDLVKSISVTTRSAREGEKHGRDYFFVSPAMFEYKKKAGHFLESQKVFNNYYGTPKKSVRDLLKGGRNVLLCIDVKGAKVVSRAFPQAVKIFVKPPSLSVLKERLSNRGSEDLSTMNLRLKIAEEELREASHYNHVVINDTLSHAYQELKKIICHEIYPR